MGYINPVYQHHKIGFITLYQSCFCMHDRIGEGPILLHKARRMDGSVGHREGLIVNLLY